MNPTRTFASGQPILDVVQTDRTPKRVFVLGVYASAVHARWTENGKTRITALAVASEPTIFWRGEGADEIIAKIQPPGNVGNLEPAGEALNGSSGRALDELILGPLAVARDNAWLCDLVPHSCRNHRQDKALRREKVPIPPSWPRVPTRLANDTRRAQILEELQASEAHVLITLGDQPLYWFAKHFGAKERLADYGQDAATYGQLHPIQIPGRTIQLLPLAHPRQIARLGVHSEEWATLHETWLTTAKPRLS
jgi:uracil-DNA glycosylase